MQNFNKTLFSDEKLKELEQQITEVWGAPADNSKYRKALIKAQNDVAETILTQRQKEVVEYCILMNYSQKETAMYLKITPSTVCREMKAALSKLNKILSLCALSIKYYQRLE